jgi:hypothetical protein
MPGALAVAMGDDFWILRSPDLPTLLEGVRRVEEHAA